MTEVKRAIGLGIVLFVLGLVLGIVGTILAEFDIEAGSGIETFARWLGNVGIIIIVTLIVALRPGGVIRKDEVATTGQY